MNSVVTDIEDRKGQNMKITDGSFATFGTRRRAQNMEFTFAAKTESGDAAIRLYDLADKKEVCRISLKGRKRIGDVYSVMVEGFCWDELCYLLEADGELFLDPYAAGTVGREGWAGEERRREVLPVYGSFADESYQWKSQGVRIAPRDMVCYKLHMRGFTMARPMAKEKKGNYLGFLSCLGELKELGVTTLEFMPLYDFEEVMYDPAQIAAASARHPMQEIEWEPAKINYWGYGPAAYFAPKASYFGGRAAAYHMKETVDAIHSQGMECIMEMSFVEGTSQDLMVDALIWWVREYRVDGFRLVGCNAPIERIAANPYLQDTKIFYDHFPGELLERESGRKHLFVCNDDFLYALRRMQNHMEGSMVEFANQMRRQNERYGFINYAADSSGFTLMDSFSYGEKHNLENGEDNRDGNPVNYSSNYGHEGETSNRRIRKIRMQQTKNAIAAVLLGQGVPMLLSGDETGNTQNGNNNAYCQDNRIGWLNVSRAKANRNLREFTRKMIAFRKAHPILSMEGAMQMKDYRHQGIPDLSYHGQEPWAMEVYREQRAIGMLYCGAYSGRGEPDLYICYNFHYQAVEIALAKLKGNRQWRMVMNTAHEMEEWKDDGPVHSALLVAAGSSVCILVSEEIDGETAVEAETPEKTVAETEDVRETAADD